MKLGIEGNLACTLCAMLHGAVTRGTRTGSFIGGAITRGARTGSLETVAGETRTLNTML